MSREFPDWIDPWKAADGRRQFGGTMPLKHLTRLAPLLAPQGPEPSGGDEMGRQRLEWPDVRFSAAFGRDRQGSVVVDLRVEADLPLICQRSLEPYYESVARRSKLAVIENAAEQEQVPDHYEPVLVEQGRLALRDLVEDELLLALPQVPRNPDVAAVQRSTGNHDEAVKSPGSDGPTGDSPGAGGGVAEPTHRPFEGLADLIKARKR